MVRVPGGTFHMGSDRHYPEEAPAHDVSVDGFWLDRTPVTNREFLKFVNATGYLTFAEIKPDSKDYPGALPQMLNSVAEFFEEDVQTNLTAAMSLIEPVILIVMGLVVTTILIALYLPIFSLSAGGAAGGQ